MLTVEALCVTTATGKRLLADVSFTLARGVCLGLTGPSGSGKTTLLRSLLGLDGDGLRLSGRIALDGQNLSALAPPERRALCGRVFGFIPQQPMTAFFPHATIGRQMRETLQLHRKLSRLQAQTLAAELLLQVHLEDTARILAAYPGALSGGMLQRIAMALILGTKPQVVLADEPTSALDAVNRDLLLRLLAEYQPQAAILFVSHDTAALRRLCSETLVLEAGSIVEQSPTAELFSRPQSDWTKRFVQAALAAEKEVGRWNFSK